jgi:hypothetical protein
VRQRQIAQRPPLGGRQRAAGWGPERIAVLPNDVRHFQRRPVEADALARGRPSAGGAVGGAGWSVGPAAGTGGGAGTGGLEPAGDLVGAEHAGELLGPLAVGEVRHLVGAAQGGAVQEAQGADDLVELAPGNLVVDQVQWKGPDLFAAEQLRRAVEVLGEAEHAGGVGLDGAGGIVAQEQVVDQALP